MIRKFFAPGNNSGSANFALFVLRLWIGFEMLLLHGTDKLTHFNTYAPKFLDPFGIGSTASLALSVFAEFFVSLLIIFGLVTRWGAMVLIINMTVAFVGVHKGALSGARGGELAFLYLMAYVVLFFAGPGRFSVDQVLFGKSEKGSQSPSKKK
jgi:putative oxidoreductase